MDLVNSMLDLMDEVEKDNVAEMTETLRAGMEEMVESVRDFRGTVQASDLFRRRCRSALSAIWKQAVTGGARLIEQYFSEGFKESKSTVFDLILSNFTVEFGTATADQILATSERQIQAMILGGMTRGEAVEAVYSEMLRKLPAMAELRGLLITRTEAHSASQYASLQMALRSSIPLKKVWNTAGDERVRDFGEVGKVAEFNHRRMNLVSAPLTQSFAVPRLGGGLEFLAFPGDPRGSAGNIINCRCVQTYERA